MYHCFQLADGSFSNQYEVGDTFTLATSTAHLKKGHVVTFQSNDGSCCPWFSCVGTDSSYIITWEDLIPTVKTKRKYQKNFTNSFTKSFTKSDLQDGMRVTLRNGKVMFILEDCLCVRMSPEEDTGDADFYRRWNHLNCYDVNLLKTSLDRDTPQDIMRVEDRDGTILFQRQEASVKKAVTLELTEEQIQSLKSQGIL